MHVTCACVYSYRSCSVHADLTLPTIRALLFSCNVLIYSLASLDRRTWHRLVLLCVTSTWVCQLDQRVCVCVLGELDAVYSCKLGLLPRSWSWARRKRNKGKQEKREAHSQGGRRRRVANQTMIAGEERERTKEEEEKGMGADTQCTEGQKEGRQWQLRSDRRQSSKPHARQGARERKTQKLQKHATSQVRSPTRSDPEPAEAGTPGARCARATPRGPRTFPHRNRSPEIKQFEDGKGKRGKRKRRIKRQRERKREFEKGKAIPSTDHSTRKSRSFATVSRCLA